MQAKGCIAPNEQHVQEQVFFCSSRGATSHDTMTMASYGAIRSQESTLLIKNKKNIYIKQQIFKGHLVLNKRAI